MLHSTLKKTSKWTDDNRSPLPALEAALSELIALRRLRSLASFRAPAPDSVLAVAAHPRQLPRTTTSVPALTRDSSTERCRYCRAFGHVKENCQKLKAKEAKTRGQTTHQVVAVAAPFSSEGLSPLTAHVPSSSAGVSPGPQLSM